MDHRVMELTLKPTLPGQCDWGFKATPASGLCMAHTLANDEPHELIVPFRLSRFSELDLVGEKGAASVCH